MLEPIRIANVRTTPTTLEVTATMFFRPAVIATDANSNPWTTPLTSFAASVQESFTGETTEQTDIASGAEIGWTPAAFVMPAGTPGAEVLANLRTRYADLAAKFQARYDAQTSHFQYVGAKFAAS